MRKREKERQTTYRQVGRRRARYFPLASTVLTVLLVTTPSLLAQSQGEGEETALWSGVVPVVQLLVDMREYLQGTSGDETFDRTVDIDIKVPADWPQPPKGSVSVSLSGQCPAAYSGDSWRALEQCGTTLDLVIDLTDDQATRTLSQQVRAEGGILRAWGTLAVDDGLSTTSYSGGWTYSAADGSKEDAASDAGFHLEAANMSGTEGTYRGGMNLYAYRGFSPSSPGDSTLLIGGTECDDITCECSYGDTSFPLYGDVDLAGEINGGEGCVTIFGAIWCSASCSELEDPSSDWADTLEHECCHACAGGVPIIGIFVWFFTWIPGDILGYCWDNAVPWH